MAKSTRGKKPKPVRKARTPRQPKSAATSVRSDEELRISLFSCVYDRERDITAILTDVEQIFDFIKKGLSVKVDAPEIKRPHKTTPEPAHLPSHVPLPENGPGIPESAQVHSPKKSHFEEDRILM